MPKENVDEAFVQMVDDLRSHLKWLGKKLFDFKGEVLALPAFPKESGKEMGEVISNLVIAYRSMEDASMRLGKAKQAWDGGASAEQNAMGNKKTNENEKQD